MKSRSRPSSKTSDSRKQPSRGASSSRTRGSTNTGSNSPSVRGSRGHEDTGVDSQTTGHQQEAASGEGKQYGEGNYEATRQYNAGLKRHIESSDVEREAREAEPRNLGEANEMREAERAGRKRSKAGRESPMRDSNRDEDIER